jgi:Tol biopolymer transport system component
MSPQRARLNSQTIAGLAKRHRIGLVAMLLVLLAAVAYTGYHLTETSGHEIAPPFSRSNTQTIKLTTSGMAKLAAISPDGKYLAYVQEGAGGQNLWVSRIGTDGDVQVVPSPTGVGYVGLTFSPDGKYLYHIEGPQSESEPPDLYRVSLVGGQSRKLIKHVNSAITFSPDGKEMAFVRHSAAKGDSQLLLWSSDGGYERVLATRKLPRLFMSGDGTGAAWSPDGRVIAVSAGALSPAFEFHPIAVDVSTGQEERLGPKRWPNVFQLAWLPGGESLLMIASVFSTPSQHQIWRISYPAGNLSRITNGRNDYVGVSLTADGGTLATVEHRTTSNIWIASKGR